MLDLPTKWPNNPIKVATQSKVQSQKSLGQGLKEGRRLESMLSLSQTCKPYLVHPWKTATNYQHATKEDVHKMTHQSWPHFPLYSDDHLTALPLKLFLTDIRHFHLKFARSPGSYHLMEWYMMLIRYEELSSLLRDVAEGIVVRDAL